VIILAVFFYLSQSGCNTVEGVDDGKDFLEVCQGMRTVGMTEDDIYYVLQCLAGILHLGNVRFQGDAPANVVDNYPLEYAAFLFGLEVQHLQQSLNHRQIQSGSARATIYEVPQNADQASSIRDALAKTVYERVFDYIVSKVNASMANKGNYKVIGVLDIYGFEIFENNSFEQFCINYVNERLQQIFIDLTVRGEQKEYHDEGMKWKDIAFFDNKIVCDLIEANNPPGIFRVLDDVCKTVHAVDSDTADVKFMERFVKQFQNHPHVVGASNGRFTLKHYAGDVEYNVSGFAFKNKDDVYPSLVQCIQLTNIPFISALFPDDMRNNKQAPTTSGHKIRTSANYLVSRLSACTPHYIRCIKPNDKKQPLNFVSSRVEHQVKYLGLLENIKVKRAGYAYRHFKDVFLFRYGQLMDQPPNSVDQFVAWIRKNVKDINADEFEEGTTKIFIRSPEPIFVMEELLMKKLDPQGYANKLQEYKEREKLAKQKAGKNSLKPKCIIQ